VDEPASAHPYRERDVRALGEAARTRYRSRHLGLSFSPSFLPVLTVFENVRLPLLLHRS
jgi:predicted ABC-type transport system involved in lysophospholipase L1 biosynthesis ATPase subunit